MVYSLHLHHLLANFILNQPNQICKEVQCGAQHSRVGGGFRRRMGFGGKSLDLQDQDLAESRGDPPLGVRPFPPRSTTAVRDHGEPSLASSVRKSSRIWWSHNERQ
ncbi:hypothetical protein L484_004802 [Morus notabilis]|uniref:Uncharacterized protein n=1 Tax=Morus notabilis TaxID=981085 RepID=W9R9Q9_9ROSA|nr:hypothetical protein L484_004802 [Morus notabilis]